MRKIYKTHIRGVWTHYFEKWEGTYCDVSEFVVVRVRNLGFTFLVALLPPQQVVFSQDSPVAAGLSSLQEVSRSQEAQHVQSQLQTNTQTHSEPCWCCDTHKEAHICCDFTSLGSSDIKSLWNCGSITCIMCFTWLVSHLSINSSRASSLSGPLHICRVTNTKRCFIYKYI